MFKKIVLTLLLTPFALLAGLLLYTKIFPPSPPSPHQSPYPTRTAAQIQEADTKNRLYLQKIDDDYYRQQISTEILKLNDIASRFNDLNRVAAASARISLTIPVQQMQAIRREAQAANTHKCLEPALISLTALIDEATNGYLSFMANGDDSTTGPTKQHFDNVKIYAEKYKTQRDACVTW